MSALRMLRIACVVCLINALLPSASSADDGYGGHGSGGLSPFFAAADWLANIPSPPYFAVHPPVYYGYRVRMVYGQSPYAPPPRRVVRDLPADTPFVPVRGLMIENPYCQTAPASAPEVPAPPPSAAPSRQDVPSPPVEPPPEPAPQSAAPGALSR